jgi:hypothetical protein
MMNDDFVLVPKQGKGVKSFLKKAIPVAAAGAAALLAGKSALDSRKRRWQRELYDESDAFD